MFRAMHEGRMAGLSDTGREGELERLRAENRALRQRIEDLDAMAFQDHLLGIPNRRGVMQEIDRMLHRYRRYGERGALLFIDLDGLKGVNDRFGHGAGDAALLHVALVIRKQLRGSDMFGRYGGDEFCALLAHVDQAGAEESADRLVRSVAANGFTFEGSSVPLDITIGTATVAEDDSAATLIARADAAMYRGKRA